MNTVVPSDLLIPAVVIITSALIFYTIGVWGERFQHRLKLWHVLFFGLGICADTAGTLLMEHIARVTGAHDSLHSITGLIAVILMAIHAVWAVWVYAAGSEQARRYFSRFSLFVWCMWLIPYCIGVYLGTTMH